MHRALEIHEIIFNIIAHCHPPAVSNFTKKPDLLALATTCRAFKEPALDLLWDDLCDLIPLVQCLPGALFHGIRYSFSRQLTQKEWEILQSYTRRIRHITYNSQQGLDEKALRILSSPPTNTPLFPNLRTLVYFHHDAYHPIGPHESFKLFSSSPYVTSISVTVDQSSISINKLVSSSVCQWQNIRYFHCPTISLDFNVLAHLARMPALSDLSFKEVTPDCTPPQVFSHARHFSLYPASLATALQLHSHILLPIVKFLDVYVDNCPSKQDLSAFLAGITSSNTGHTLQSIRLDQPRGEGSMDTSLSLKDLRPCMEFSDLRMLRLDIAWEVGLTDDDLVTLASAWPNLEELLINLDWGWNTQGGITPNGFLQLLQKCPSLNYASLVMDTRGYTEMSPTNPGLTLPRRAQPLALNVLDSIIEEDSVSAINAFFQSIHLSSVDSWDGNRFEWPPESEAYKERWEDVNYQIILRDFRNVAVAGRQV